MTNQQLTRYCKSHQLFIYEVTELSCDRDYFFNEEDPQAYIDDTEPNIYLQLIDESDQDNLKTLVTGTRDDIINYLKTKAGD